MERQWTFLTVAEKWSVEFPKIGQSLKNNGNHYVRVLEIFEKLKVAY